MSEDEDISAIRASIRSRMWSEQGRLDLDALIEKIDDLRRQSSALVDENRHLRAENAAMREVLRAVDKDSDVPRYDVYPQGYVTMLIPFSLVEKARDLLASE